MLYYTLDSQFFNKTIQNTNILHLPLFLLFLELFMSIWFHSTASQASFYISCAGLLAMNSLCFCYLKKAHKTLPSHLKDIFTGYKFLLSWLLFSFSTIGIRLCCSLARLLSDKKSAQYSCFCSTVLYVNFCCF